MDNDGDDVSMACEEDEEGRNKGKTATSSRMRSYMRLKVCLIQR